MPIAENFIKAKKRDKKIMDRPGYAERFQSSASRWVIRAGRPRVVVHVRIESPGNLSGAANIRGPSPQVVTLTTWAASTEQTTVRLEDRLPQSVDVEKACKPDMQLPVMTNPSSQAVVPSLFGQPKP